MESLADWKSVVDPSTGKTYWYHRKTRATTWTKPVFKEELEKQQPPPPSLDNINNYSSETKEIKLNETYHHKTVTIKESRPPTASIPKKIGIVFEKESRSVRFYPSDSTAKDEEHLKQFYLQLPSLYLSSLAENSEIINDLLKVISRQTNIATNTSKITLYAIKCLWRISCDKNISNVVYLKKSQWVQLIPSLATLQLSLIPSAHFYLLALLNNLMIGTTASLYTSRLLEKLLKYCKQSYEQYSEQHRVDTGQQQRRQVTLPDTETEQLLQDLLLDPSTSQISKYRALIDNGHHSTAYFILALEGLTQSTPVLTTTNNHHNKPSTAGAAKSPYEECLVSLLLQIAASRHFKSSDHVQQIARQSLLVYMTQSRELQAKILDGLLSFSRDLSSGMLCVGIQPSLMVVGSVGNDGQEEACAIAALPLGRARGGGGSADEEEQAEERTTEEQQEQAAEREIEAEARAELVYEESVFPRDVEWICVWQVNSSFLYLRCPALRSLILDFWAQGNQPGPGPLPNTGTGTGGTLELSIETNASLMEIIVRYLHTGLLCLPPIGPTAGSITGHTARGGTTTSSENSSRVQMVMDCYRVSRELGLESLCLALEQELSLHVTEQVYEIMKFSEQYGLKDLNKACEQCMLGTSTGTGISSTQNKGNSRTLPQGRGGGSGTMMSRQEYQEKEAQDLEHDLLALSGILYEDLDRDVSSKKHYPTMSVSLGGDVGLDEDLYLEEEEEGCSSNIYNKDHTKPSSSTKHQQQPVQKVKSGGIYGLLLNGSHDAEEYHPPTHSNNKTKPSSTSARPSSAPRNTHSASTPRASSTVQGKVMTTSTVVDLGVFGNVEQYSQTMALEPVSYHHKEGSKEGNKKGSSRLEELARPRDRNRLSSGGGGKEEVGVNESVEVSQDSATTPSQALDKTQKIQTVGGGGGRKDKEKESKGVAGSSKITEPSKKGTVGKPIAAATTTTSTLSSTSAATREKEVEKEEHEYDNNSEDHMTMMMPQRVNNAEPRRSFHKIIASAEDPEQQTTTATTNNNSDNSSSSSVRSSLALLKSKVTSHNNRRVSRGGGGSAVIKQPPSGFGFGQPSDTEVRSSVESWYTRDKEKEEREEEEAGDGYSKTAAVTASTTTLKSKTPPSNQQTQSQTKTAGIGTALSSYRDDENSDNYYQDKQKQKQVPPPPSSAVAAYANRPPPAQLKQAPYMTPDQDEEDDDDEPYHSSSGGQYDYSHIDADADGGNQATHECPDCHRHFAQGESYTKHVRICKKVFLQKRKVFDSSKQRIIEAEAAAALALAGGVGSKKNSRASLGSTTANKGEASPATGTPAASKWKEQSKQFRAAMRAARGLDTASDDVLVPGGGQGTGSSSSAKVPYVDPSLVQCPNCLRRFNDKAAERHLPLCKNILAKPTSLKKGGGINASNSVTTNSEKVSLQRSAGGTGMGAVSKRGWQ